jgi:hypothetical protein
VTAGSCPIHVEVLLSSLVRALSSVSRAVIALLTTFGVLGAMANPANAANGGASSPAGVVTGFFGAMTHDHLEATCIYFAPGPPRDTCQSDLAQLPSGAGGSGSIHVVRTVVKGSHALVAVTGRVCTEVPGGSSQCDETNNANADMPSTRLSFAAAYAAAAAGIPNSVGPLPCVKVHGRWYDGASET